MPPITRMMLTACVLSCLAGSANARPPDLTPPADPASLAALLDASIPVPVASRRHAQHGWTMPVPRFGSAGGTGNFNGNGNGGNFNGNGNSGNFNGNRNAGDGNGNGFATSGNGNGL